MVELKQLFKEEHHSPMLFRSELQQQEGVVRMGSSAKGGSTSYQKCCLPSLCMFNGRVQ